MLHKSTVHAGNNRWIHIKFICFMSLTILCLIGSIFLAISFGAKDIHLQTVWAAILNYDPKLTQHQIIYELRLPRVIGAAVVGAAFAVAGAVMQGITRNPLADAGVLGINAGAMFVVALSFAFFSAYAVFLFNDCFLYWSSLKHSTYFCYWISNIRRVNTNEVNDCWSGYGSAFTFIKFRCCDLL